MKLCYLSINTFTCWCSIFATSSFPFPLNPPHGQTLEAFIHSIIIREALPEELGSRGPHLDEPAGQALALNHRGHGGQAVPLHQPARHPRGSAALPGRDDDAQAVVPATAHGSAPGIHHEADQEAEVEQDIQQIKDISHWPH